MVSITESASRFAPALAPIALIAVTSLILLGCESPIDIDQMTAEVPVTNEVHRDSWLQLLPAGKGVLIPINHPATDTFTLLIEGQSVDVRVTTEAAKDFDPGDNVQVTYSKSTYKDGTVSISDVKVVSR